MFVGSGGDLHPVASGGSGPRLVVKPASMSTAAGAVTVAPTLRRELGRWDLTAIGINQVIGSAIFLMPSQVAAQIGGWSILAFVLTGLASLLVGLCFAEVGSRFERTGGPYLFTRAAFGRFVAFEVGWMQWFTRATSHASVINGLALAIGFYLAPIAGGAGRVALIVGLTVALALIQVRGIRESSWVINALTIGKLVPLGAFILAGLFFIDLDLVGPFGPISLEQASTAALLLIFVYGGYDVIPVTAGEAANPRRHIPFAMITTLLTVTGVMTLGQFVAHGTLPNLAASKTPLQDASLLIMGSAGALMISIGSMISMTGNVAGQILNGSRMLFALGENGELPRFFGRVHPRFRTPANAILFTTVVTLYLALSGTFVTMAALSAVARLITYTGTCAATLALRSPRYAGLVQPATYVVPLGPIVPAAAIAISMTILAGATRTQLVGGLWALAAGAAFFFVNDRLRKTEGSRFNP